MAPNREKISQAKINHFTTLSSTNDTAREMLNKGEDAPFWIVTDEQTKGRGRQGKEWVSIAGNLFASFAITLPITTPNISGLSLLACLALRDAILCTLPFEDKFSITLKWPNDLLINNAKVAGILIENQNNTKNDTYELVLGFGLNIQSHPDLADRETTCLHNWEYKASRDVIFQSLTNNMDKWFEIWRSGENFSEIRSSWLEHAQPIGSPVVIMQGDQMFEGQFEGLDNSGALLLKLKDGMTKTITAGEQIL